MLIVDALRWDFIGEDAVEGEQTEKNSDVAV